MLALMLGGIGVGPAAATVIDLTSGVAGEFSGGQSFNEIRAVEVRVVAWAPFQLSSIGLAGLDLGGAESALVGARIYLSSSMQLIATANTTITASGPVSLSLSTVLTPGESYRIGFFVETTPGGDANATLFLPNQFPYFESAGVFLVQAAFAFPDDAYPAFENVAVPQISLTGAIVPEPAALALMLGGGVALAAVLRRRRAAGAVGRP